MTVKYPNVFFDSGTSDRIDAHGGARAEGNGIWSYDHFDAPFGTYYSVGVVIPPGCGVPESAPTSKDRIWNGQTGLLHLRK